MLKRIISPDWNADRIDSALLFLRVSVSLLMLRYGYMKLTKVLSGDMGFADPIGLGEQNSLYLTVFAEFFCSILLILGLLTRAALFPLIFTMLVGFFIVHKNDAFDMREHPLVFLIPYLTLWLTGAGRFSLDNFIFKQNKI